MNHFGIYYKQPYGYHCINLPLRGSKQGYWCWLKKFGSHLWKISYSKFNVYLPSNTCIYTLSCNTCIYTHHVTRVFTLCPCSSRRYFFFSFLLLSVSLLVSFALFSFCFYIVLFTVIISLLTSERICYVNLHLHICFCFNSIGHANVLCVFQGGFYFFKY